MSAVMGSSVVEFDLACDIDGFGEADRRMLDSDLWWPKVGRPLDEGWWGDHPATVTKLCHGLLVTAM